MEPIWDWNLSFGNANYLEGWKPEGWYWPLASGQDYFWFDRLFEDRDFKQRHIDRWFQLRTNQFALPSIMGKIDALNEQLREAQARNFQRWPILGQWVWPNRYVGKTHAEEVNWMKRWITQRIAWIDAKFLPGPSVEITHGVNAPDHLLNLRAATGEIYYTLDGSDPRSPGGAASPKAQRYVQAVTIGAAAHGCARAYLAKNWSSPVVFRIGTGETP